MKSCHRNRCCISSQLMGSTTMKKMAKEIVGNSMSGAHSRIQATRNRGAPPPLRPGR